MKIEGKKRINITCPKCHHDYAINGDALYQRKRQLIEEMEIIKAQMSAYKDEHNYSKSMLNSDGYYKKLRRRLKEKQAEYATVKTDIANADTITEINLFGAFKKKLFEVYGKEEIVKLLEECEEDMQYRDYDLAIQHHTNFNNI